MIQELTSLGKTPAADSSVRLLCSHTNVTRRIQIIRITDSPDLRWERIIFPGQRLMFESVPEAQLEIKFSENMSVFLPCEQLRVTEKTKVK